MSSDRDIITGIIDGDVDSYEKLFIKYYPLLIHFIVGMLKNPTASEDVAQNIFMKVWQNRRNLDREKSIKNYLFVLAKNEILNIFKSKYMSHVDLCPKVDEACSKERSVDETYNYLETRLKLSKEIEKMPVKRRRIFIMSRYEHMSNAEIAERMDISVRTVEKHIQLAMKELHKSFS